MGPTEVPSQSLETIKVPTAHYEFGANFIDPKVFVSYNLVLSMINFYLNRRSDSIVLCLVVDAFWKGYD